MAIDSRPGRQKGVLALINFSYEELTWNCFPRPLMRQGCEGRRKESYPQERIATHEEWKKPGFMPLRLQPKEEMKVKTSDKWSKHRQNDDNWSRPVSDGWKLALIQGSPHSPILYTPKCHPDIIKAGTVYSYKSLLLGCFSDQGP